MSLRVLSQYKRTLRPLSVSAKVKSTKCKYHVAQSREIRKIYATLPYCGIIKDPRNRTELTYVHCRDNNYQDHVPLHLCPLSKQLTNLLKDFPKLELGENDYCKSNCFAMCLAKNKLISYKLFQFINGLALKDLTLSPAAIRDNIVFHHQQDIQLDLQMNYPLIEYKAVEVKEMANTYVLSLHYFKLIIAHLIKHVWAPTQLKWKMATWKMGGDVAAIDWCFNTIKLLYLTEDCYTDDNTKELLQTVDSRAHQQQAKVATFSITNRYNYECDLSLTPNSEAHCYCIPKICRYYVGCLLFSEIPCYGLTVKHDGMDGGKDLGIKTGYTIKKFIAPKINGYDIDELLPNFQVCRAKYIYIYIYIYIQICCFHYKLYIKTYSLPLILFIERVHYLIL